MKSGRVEKAANDAAPKTPQEAEEMRRAEQVGRSHSKGDDTKIPSKTEKTGQGNSMIKTRVAGGIKKQAGKIGYILLWALGVPIPILLLFYFLRGCS